ncbi:hypothetical protein [Rhabdothermincola salaria]|uniref:hypothetical protein n=1 Tax=Rhabdothermincola salaria TaxID=2903142 RepID=UPI001E44E9DB|nr:hypothetical protein [Rhabdothermincola salaria]MCD9622795.1 hypothetical protein [Rhabdothermincola salaria]
MAAKGVDEKARWSSPVWLAAVVVVAVGMAAVVAFATPAGQPYDEPSHWDTVAFYGAEHRLPELGRPGVTYQAQMGPVFYGVGGAVLWAMGADVTNERGFSAVRLLSVALVAAVVVLTHRLARRLVPGREGVALASAAFMGLTPTVTLFSGSVQNDTAALVAALAAAVLASGLLARLGDASVRPYVPAGGPASAVGDGSPTGRGEPAPAVVSGQGRASAASADEGGSVAASGVGRGFGAAGAAGGASADEGGSGEGPASAGSAGEGGSVDEGGTGRTGATEDWWRWIALGAVIGVAVLTKVQTLALVPAVVVGALMVPAANRRRALVGAGVALLAAAVVSGWWFLRNLAVYGDPTGRSAIERSGETFDPLPLAGLGDVASWVRSLISAVWVPTEYHRNAYEAPLVLRGAAVAATVAVVALVVWWLATRWRGRGSHPATSTSTSTFPSSSTPAHSSLPPDVASREAPLASSAEPPEPDTGRRRSPDPGWARSRPRVRPEVAFAWAWATITFVAYVVIAFGMSSLGPRAVYVAAAPIVIGVAALVDRLLPNPLSRIVAVGTLGFALGVDIWLAVQASRIPEQVFWIPLT